eukprot:Transcript_31770.p3 GENE.Transcript_31770~~Transcript_31770.p3  ORF type:complete len:282 (+),score=98.78 Transcript_31770:68-913(+)
MAEVPFTQSELRALFQQHAGADGLVAASLLFQPRVCAPADQQDVRAWAGRASMSKKQRFDVDTFLSLVPEARASVGGAPVDLTPKITAEWMARLDAALPTREDFLDEGPALLGRGGALGGGLYLGSYAQAQDLELLCRLGVRAVVNCAPSDCKPPRAQYDAAGVELLCTDAKDYEGYLVVERHLGEVVAFLAPRLEEAGGVALVHCMQGVNRSATLALAFLVTKQRAALLSSIRAAHALRPIILQNVSFRLQLLQLAAQHGLLNEPKDAPAPPALAHPSAR